MSNKDNIEQLFSKRFDGAESPVNSRVWENIRQSLPPEKEKKPLMRYLMYVGAVLSIFSVGTYYFANSLSENQTVATNESGVNNATSKEIALVSSGSSMDGSSVGLDKSEGNISHSTSISHSAFLEQEKNVSTRSNEANRRKINSGSINSNLNKTTSNKISTKHSVTNSQSSLTNEDEHTHIGFVNQKGAISNKVIALETTTSQSSLVLDEKNNSSGKSLEAFTNKNEERQSINEAYQNQSKFSNNESEKALINNSLNESAGKNVSVAETTSSNSTITINQHSSELNYNLISNNISGSTTSTSNTTNASNQPTSVSSNKSKVTVVEKEKENSDKEENIIE